jgi:hypothetical protein
MSTPDLHSRLQNSIAMDSLTSEQRIFSILEGLDWKTVHSCFYSDVTTQKIREIDIVGIQGWGRPLKHGWQRADLHLLVESKSAKGYHLLFAPLKQLDEDDLVNFQWLGLDGVYREQIANILDKAGLKLEQAAYVLKRLESLAYLRRLIVTGL